MCDCWSGGYVGEGGQCIGREIIGTVERYNNILYIIYKLDPQELDSAVS